jgi:hypothetical protein
MSYKQIPSYAGASPKLNLEPHRTVVAEPQSAISVAGIGGSDQHNVMNPGVVAVDLINHPATAQGSVGFLEEP